jgi:SAM-dependent methyltransferase
MSDVHQAPGSFLVSEKRRVQAFWDRASCGEELLLSEHEAAYDKQAEERYRLEPYIPGFADFPAAWGRAVLEIGVGLGADHEQFARAGAVLHGVDLTPRAVKHTTRRLAAQGLKSQLFVADAENLPFPDGSFDIVYSWGVIHHSPDTPKAVSEIYRVLKPGGVCKVMIYHTYSMVGYMLWVRYALLTLRWRLSLADIYSRYLESPGTKAYTHDEAYRLFEVFSDVNVWSVLTHGDLLTSGAGQRHRGALLSFARLIWPRWVIRRLLPHQGLFLMISARKSA